MDQIMVVYWSQTGNTGITTNAVTEGMKEAGKECTIAETSSVSADVPRDAPVFTLGCPATEVEILEEDEMESFMEVVEAFAGGKRIGLFGSYGWGDGQWMRDWEECVQNAGAVPAGDQGVIAQEVPDEDALSQCRGPGKPLAGLLAQNTSPCPVRYR